MLVDHAGLATDRQHGAEAVEQIDEHEREDAGPQRGLQGAGDVELKGDRCRRGGERNHARGPGRNPGQYAGGGGRENAEQNGAANPSGFQQDGDQQAAQAEQGLRGEGAELHQHSFAFHHQPEVLQADEGDEQADADGGGQAQGGWNGLHQPFADAEPGQQQKKYPGKKNHPESGWPGHALPEHQGIGEKGIEAHARRHHQRRIGPQGDQRRSHGGHQTGHGGQRALVHSGLGENGRMHENDVGAGQKGGQSGNDFGADRGPVTVQLKQSFEHGGLPCAQGFRPLRSLKKYSMSLLTPRLRARLMPLNRASMAWSSSPSR